LLSVALFAELLADGGREWQMFFIKLPDEKLSPRSEQENDILRNSGHASQSRKPPNIDRSGPA
jgi:hypothetical protein